MEKRSEAMDKSNNVKIGVKSVRTIQTLHVFFDSFTKKQHIAVSQQLWEGNVTGRFIG